MGSRHINLLTVCRTGNLQSQFFSEFSDLLGRLVIKSPTLFVTGHFNIHLEKPDDRNCLAFRDLISSFGLRRGVEGATHDCGGLLDIVLERDDKDKPNTVVLLRKHRFDQYLKNLHLIHNYLRHTDQFPISSCFQSFWSALFSAVSSPTTTMHYFQRHSQHIVRTTPRKLLS